MQYVEHNFFQNFDAAFKSKDAILMNDILADEIAKLITFDKARVIAALNNAKIPTDATISDTAITKLIHANIAKNDALSKNIIALMLDNNGHSANGLLITGAGNKQQNSGPVTQKLQTGIKMCFSQGCYEVLNKKRARHLVQKGYKLSVAGDESTIKAKNTAKVVFWSVFGTAALITVAYFGLKYMAKKKGGVAEGVADVAPSAPKSTVWDGTQPEAGKI